MTRRGTAVAFGLLVLTCGAVGCGTTRMTDTTRAASEMLLVSAAVDNAIAEINCTALKGQSVFLDVQYLDGTVDKGYVISSLRQHLLAHGVKLREDRKESDVIVEARSGAVGTDRSSLLLLGTPSMSIPVVVTGQPSQIPEIALIKKTDMKGVAKIAVFAYERKTGEAVWQSGLMESRSTLKDLWLMGAGPFSSGSIKRRTELAGEELPRLPLPFAPNESDPRAKGEPTPAVKQAGHEEPEK
jgi:hypothetical protein